MEDQNCSNTFSYCIYILGKCQIEYLQPVVAGGGRDDGWCVIRPSCMIWWRLRTGSGSWLVSFVTDPTSSFLAFHIHNMCTYSQLYLDGNIIHILVSHRNHVCIRFNCQEMAVCGAYLVWQLVCGHVAIITMWHTYMTIMTSWHIHDIMTAGTRTMVISAHDWQIHMVTTSSN